MPKHFALGFIGVFSLADIGQLVYDWLYQLQDDIWEQAEYEDCDD